jgi:streptogramin lyase
MVYPASETFWIKQRGDTDMRIGRLVGWRRTVSGPAGRPDQPGLALRRRRLRRRLRGPVAVLAGVPLLSFGLAAGAVSAASGATGAASAASGAGSMTIYPSIDGPVSITAGPDGALWFTSFENNSIGRITTTGQVRLYARAGIDGPEGITAGPDGALWFTNVGNNSIGRITTTGTVTNYRRGGIDFPEAITAGPDGNLWFTNSSNDSIGRITPAVTPGQR